VLETIRLGFFWGDSDLIKLNIAEADRLLVLGGDWDRRNRLKVYRALFAMMSRDFVSAAGDFQSAVATFTSYELCSYSTFVFYTVLTSVVALERTEFKKQVCIQYLI
jgi:26S proteasome regulatory subunit N7